MEISLNDAVKAKILQRGIELNAQQPLKCRDFRIMTSPLWPGSLLLRYKTIDLSDPSEPQLAFRYECFDAAGTPMLCSVYYGDPEEAMAFYDGLTTLHQQTFANDHLNPDAHV